VPWQLPHHLVGLPVSGVSFAGGTAALRQRIIDQARQIAERDAQLAWTTEALRRAGLRSRLKRFLGLER
jgi:hypothetical protein